MSVYSAVLSERVGHERTAPGMLLANERLDTYMRGALTSTGAFGKSCSRLSVTVPGTWRTAHPRTHQKSRTIGARPTSSRPNPIRLATMSPTRYLEIRLRYTHYILWVW